MALKSCINSNPYNILGDEGLRRDSSLRDSQWQHSSDTSTLPYAVGSRHLSGRCCSLWSRLRFQCRKSLSYFEVAGCTWSLSSRRVSYSLDCAYQVVEKADIYLKANAYLKTCDVEAGDGARQSRVNTCGMISGVDVRCLVPRAIALKMTRTGIIYRLRLSLALFGELLSLHSRLQGMVESWTTLRGLSARSHLASPWLFLSFRLRGEVYVSKIVGRARSRRPPTQVCQLSGNVRHSH